jgi:hypothetical protein
MTFEEDDVLKIGDMVEFYCSGNPHPQPEWQPQRVEEIRIVEDYDDKEGVPVSQVSWRNIRDYICLVVVLGTEKLARNDELRPVAKPKQKQ